MDPIENLELVQRHLIWRKVGFGEYQTSSAEAILLAAQERYLSPAFSFTQIASHFTFLLSLYPTHEEVQTVAFPWPDIGFHLRTAGACFVHFTICLLFSFPSLAARFPVQFCSIKVYPEKMLSFSPFLLFLCNPFPHQASSAYLTINTTFPISIQDISHVTDLSLPNSAPYINTTSLRKRHTISLTLKECAEGLRFKQSQCHSSISPRYHSITCVYYGWDGTPRGSLSPLQ